MKREREINTTQESLIQKKKKTMPPEEIVKTDRF